MRARFLFLALVGLLAVAFMAWLTREPSLAAANPNQTQVIYAEEDAYVFSGLPYNNFGGTDDLRLGLGMSEIGPLEKRIYLKFPPIQPPENTKVTKLTLQLYLTQPTTTPMYLSVLRAGGAWNEGDITWLNQPDTEGIGLWIDIPPSPAGWLELNLQPVGETTAILWDYRNANDGLVIQLRKSPIDAYPDIPFYSGNNPRFGPRIIIQYEPLPTATPTPTPTNTPTPTPLVILPGTPTPTPITLNLHPFAIEVTQGIQDLHNSVRLVSGKRTFVRLHVYANQGKHWTYAYLRVKRGDQEKTLYPINGFLGHIAVSPQPDRGKLNDSFLFELPQGFRSGTVTIKAYLNPVTYWRSRNPKEANYNDNTLTTTVHFEKVRPLNLVTTRIHYQWNNTWYGTSKYHADRLVSWLSRAYPVPRVNHWDRAFFWPDPANIQFYDNRWRFKDPNCGDVNNYLMLLYIKALLPWGPKPSYPASANHYGLVIYDNGGFMRGCSPGAIRSSGPTGDPNISMIFQWDQDDSFGDWYGGHEMGHTLGRPHAPFCKAKGTAPYPYPNGKISPTEVGSVALYGFDIETKAIYPPTWTDVMSYCDYEWLSDFTYEALMDYLQNNPVTQAASPPSQETRQESAAPAQTQPAQALLVSGIIDASGDGSKLNPAWTFPVFTAPPRPEPGPYVLSLRGPRGELARYAFQPESLHFGPDPFGPPGEDDTPDLAIFSVVIPYPTGANRIDILAPDGSLVLSNQVGSHPPTITLLSPNGGETISGDSLTVSWTASDPDGDPLSYMVDYSPDGGFTWDTVAAFLTDTQVTIPTENLPGGENARIRVWATDGIHTASDTSDAAFTVPNHTPTVEVIAPDAGTLFTPHQTITLKADAYDVESGSDIDAIVRWTSDQEGFLGYGRELPVTLTRPGQHHITVEVDDGMGGVATDSIVLTVLEAPLAPPDVFLPMLLR